MNERQPEPIYRQKVQSLYAQYTLQPSEIRILVLHPSRNRADPIECTFETVNLGHDHLDYEAVSYTWGDPVEGWQLDDQRMNLCSLNETIKGNLAAALRRFRHETNERRLWVDALCINQADHGERAQQVAMMAQIYSRAARTLVWLGEDTEEVDGAVIISACKAIDVDGPSFGSMNDDERQLWSKQMHQALDPTLHFSSPWKSAGKPTTEMFDELEYLIVCAAQAFIHRRYFTRRWVLQELFNAKSAIVHCGAYKINWDVLIKGCKRLPIEIQRPAPVDPGMDMVQVGVYLEALDTYSSPVLDLMWCLKYFGTSECSDQRDRIYALLGFSSGANIIKADYSIPPAEVWLKVGLALIREGYSGLLVTTAAEQFYQGFERAAGLPSWLPDFSSPTDLLPRDYPQGESPVVDEHNCLVMTARCFGEVRYHNGWPICTGMPEKMLEKVRSLPFGGWSKNPSGYWDSYYFGVPLLKSVANELRTGDLICEVPNRKLRTFCIVVRRLDQYVDLSDEETFGAIVGIASVTSNGECLSSSLRRMRIR
jgi:hypothetical protein